MRAIAAALSAIVALPLISGCATYMCLESERKPVYGGTRTDAQMGVYLAGISLGLNSTEPDAPDRLVALALSAQAFADLPCSVVADTIALPVTVWAACNWKSTKLHAAGERAGTLSPASGPESEW